MWTSKLNNKYDLAWIQQQDASSQRELHRLRSLKELGNHLCADCGRPDSSWASVTHGVFLCITCSDVHRSVGTHVTKVKGCTGTYLWGPDELERMQALGNCAADQRCGSAKVSPDSSKEEKQRYVVNKYGKQWQSAVAACSNAFELSDTVMTAPCEVVNEEEKRCGVVQVEEQCPVSDKMPKERRGAGRATLPRSVPAGCAIHALRRAAQTGTGSALLPSSVPAGKRGSELPDSLFDELFGDWTEPVLPSKEAPQLSHESDHGATDEHPAFAKVPPQLHLSQYGALDVVDDIFAELNKL